MLLLFVEIVTTSRFLAPALVVKFWSFRRFIGRPDEKETRDVKNGRFESTRLGETIRDAVDSDFDAKNYCRDIQLLTGREMNIDWTGVQGHLGARRRFSCGTFG
jgi:hypothetical protein